VLKFIGDGVLAIFPSEGDMASACNSAIAAMTVVAEQVGETGPEVNLSTGPAKPDCAAGIAFGQVTYGNVGSRERLDFTVVGTPANLAARLSDLGKKIGQAVVVSEHVRDVVDMELLPLGTHELHNISGQTSAYGIGPE